MLRLQIQIQGKLIRLTIRNYIANKVHVCVCVVGEGVGNPCPGKELSNMLVIQPYWDGSDEQLCHRLSALE